MTVDIVKEGYELAEKEAREQQVQEVKRIVSKTLEKLDEVKGRIRELQEEEKILKLDIDNLKEGKIDRIVERQEKDPKAKEVSVVVIIKEKEIIKEVSPWYWPYRVMWNQPLVVATPSLPVYGSSIGMFGTTAGDSVVGQSFISCSVAKDAVPGAYDIDGHGVHLR